MTRTTTVSMGDRVAEIRQEEIPYRREMRDEIRQTAQEEYDRPWQVPDELEARYAGLEDEISTLEGEASILEEKAEEFGSGEFVIRELSAGAVGMIQDDVAEASDVDFQGNGTPKSGYARNRALEVAIVEAPGDAPEVKEIADAVADWLYNCIDEFNSTGEVSLGNSSLRADLMNSES